MRPFGLGNRANRPVRGDPFARGMREHGRQIHDTGRLINRGRLHRGDLMLTEGLAYDLKTTGKRRVTELRAAGRRARAVRNLSEYRKYKQLKIV